MIERINFEDFIRVLGEILGVLNKKTGGWNDEHALQLIEQFCDSGGFGFDGKLSVIGARGEELSPSDLMKFFKLWRINDIPRHVTISDGMSIFKVKRHIIDYAIKMHGPEPVGRVGIASYWHPSDLLQIEKSILKSAERRRNGKELFGFLFLGNDVKDSRTYLIDTNRNSQSFGKLVDYEDPATGKKAAVPQDLAILPSNIRKAIFRRAPKGFLENFAEHLVAQSTAETPATTNE